MLSYICSEKVEPATAAAADTETQSLAVEAAYPLFPVFWTIERTQI